MAVRAEYGVGEGDEFALDGDEGQSGLLATVPEALVEGGQGRTAVRAAMYSSERGSARPPRTRRRSARSPLPRWTLARRAAAPAASSP